MKARLLLLVVLLVMVAGVADATNITIQSGEGQRVFHDSDVILDRAAYSFLQNMTLYYPMNDSGLNFTSLIGNASDNAYTPDDVFITRLSSYLSRCDGFSSTTGRCFDSGSTDEYFFINGSNHTNANQVWGAWIKTNSSSSPTITTILSTLNQGGQNGYEIHLNADNTVGCVYGYAGGTPEVDSLYVIPKNTWTHVMCMWNISRLSVFVNGTENKSISAPNPIVPSIRGSIGNRVLGALQWNGSLDEVVTFNYSLSAANINNLFRIYVNQTYFALSLSTIFNQSVVILSNNTIYLQVNASLYPNSTAALTYNGSTYNATANFGSGVTTFQASITNNSILNGVNPTNLTFFWNFSLFDTSGGSYNGTTNLSNASQLIYNPAILVYARDESNASLITQSVTVTFTTNDTAFSIVTTNGSVYAPNLSIATYTVQLSSANYAQRSYLVTTGGTINQTLTAYLPNSTSSTIFTVSDADTSRTIEGALMIMYKVENGSWATIQSQYTDVSGKVQFYYVPLQNYKFFLSYAGYSDYVFYLSPVLFSTYDVAMSRETASNYSQDFSDVAVIYGPRIYRNATNDTFGFLIAAPSGNLLSYGFTLSYHDAGGGTVTVSQSGSSALGGQLSTNLTPYAVDFLDSVSLSYYYETNVGGVRYFGDVFPFYGPGNVTAVRSGDRTYGMTVFERVLVMTVIILLILGVSALAGQVIGGTVLSMVVMWFLVHIGFIPVWLTVISIFMGIMYIIWRSGGV